MLLDLLEKHVGQITVRLNTWSYKHVDFDDADEIGIGFTLPKTGERVVVPWTSVKSVELN